MRRLRRSEFGPRFWPMAKRDIKPITHLKNHAAALVREISEEHRTVIITQNGEAKVAIMDIETFDRWQDAMALLKILARGQADVDAGRTVTQAAAFVRARAAIDRVEREE